MVTKKKKPKVKKRADAVADAEGRAEAAAAAEAAPVHDSAAEEPAGLTARERRAAEEAEYQVGEVPNPVFLADCMAVLVCRAMAIS